MRKSGRMNKKPKEESLCQVPGSKRRRVVAEAGGDDGGDHGNGTGTVLESGGRKTKSVEAAIGKNVATVKQHPLLNDVVLRNVFKYGSSLEEVKRNRLVCQTWLEASNSQWTKVTKTLTLYRGEESSAGEGKTLNELWNSCREAKGPLEKTTRHRKFLFHGWTFDQALLDSLRNAAGDSGTEGGIAAENWLWNRLAPTLITDLTLSSCRFPVEFTPFTQNFLRVLPNLERLTVENSVAGSNVLAIRLPDQLMVQRIFMGGFGLLFVEAWIPPAGPFFQHEKLRFLKIKVSPGQEHSAEELVKFLIRVPKVETIVLRGFDLKGLNLFFQFLERAPATGRTLKTLDVLDLSMKAFVDGIVGKCGDYQFMFRALTEFHYDIGYESGYGRKDLSSIQYRMRSLEKLHLYRAPFVKTYPSVHFFQEQHSGIRSCFLSITQLHLWGNLADSLDFLNNFPSLTTLVMNTSCYEETYHGRRVYQKLEKVRKICYPLMERDLVKSTTSLEITHLTKLEIDWTLTSAKSWSQLAAWMPTLVTLKAKIMNQSQLAEIRKEFGSLENLELAHGSMISGEGVLIELPRYPNLRTFSWKVCPCTERLWKDDVFGRLRELGQELGIQLYRKSVVPWKLPSDHEKVFQENRWSRRTRSGSKICIQAEYEKMLKTGDSREYLKMMNI